MNRTALFLFGFLLISHPSEGAFDQGTYEKANELLTSWNLSEAEKFIKALSLKNPSSEPSSYLMARLEFLKGDYDNAWEILKSSTPTQPYWIDFKTLVKKTNMVTSKFVSRESDHFIFYFVDGPDEILVHYAAEVLESSYEALGKALDFYPQEKVRVEFYPSREPFSKISPLTLKDILTSGTVALCKYNRIMTISPGSLVRGYDWMDTLSHEYVHYVLTIKSRNTVPLWLHEGLAKYFETRWRENSKKISPLLETALAKGLEADYFISLSDMMPSFAKLKTAEDVQLAYAEVYSMVEYMTSLRGDAVILQILDLLFQGLNMRETVSIIFGLSLKDFQVAWKQYALTKNYKSIPGIKTLQFKFKNDRNVLDKEDSKDYKQIGSKEAADFTFLGDILKSRSYLKAAILEYEKAIESTGTLSPILYNKLAMTLLLTKAYKKAESLLQKSLQYYPYFHTTLINLGELYYQTQNFPTSLNYFEKAVRINPFNPFAHVRLIDLFKKLNQTEKKEIQTRLFQFLE